MWLSKLPFLFCNTQHALYLYLHIKWQLDLCLQIAVVYFEEAVHKFSQIDVLCFTQVHDGEEPLANNAWQIAVGQQCHLVDPFWFVVGLRRQIFEDIFEVRYGNILLKLLVVEDLVVDKLNLVRSCLIIHRGVSKYVLMLIKVRIWMVTKNISQIN